MSERPVGRPLSALLANVRAERIRKVAALAGRSARRREGLMLVEGPQAVRELVAFRPKSVRDVYVSEAALAERGPLHAIADAALAAGLHVHPATSEVMAAVSGDAQGIAAVATTADAIAQPAVAAGASMVAILSNVRDPGNAGAAIRVADAAGADAVVLAGESVDPANPKVVRASAGSIFHVPVLTGMALGDAVAAARDAGLQVCAADVSGDVELGAPGAPAATDPTAWVFGNEAWGLSADDLALADRIVRIPIPGHAESLNLGTAVAVVLYTTVIQRRAESR